METCGSCSNIFKNKNGLALHYRTKKENIN